ncbi:hypothetical protein ACFL6C_09070 [Myxococcota bacterium]
MTLLPVWLLIAAAGGTPVASSGEDPRPLTVSVDISRVDRKVFDRLGLEGIYKSLLIRLMQEDVAVVDVRREADIALELNLSGREILKISIEAGGLSDAVNLPLVDGQHHNLRYAIIHRSVELFRLARSHLLSTAQRRSIPLPVAGPETTEESPLESSRESRAKPLPGAGELRQSNASLGLLGTWRSGQQGLFLDLSTCLTGAEHLSWCGSLILHAPLGIDSDDLSILEWGLRGGVSWRTPLLGEWLFWDSLLMAGVWSHHYWFEGLAATDSGHRLDPAVTVGTGLSFRITPNLEARCAGGVLWTFTDRVHKIGGTKLWRSTEVRGLFGVGLTYLFSP